PLARTSGLEAIATDDRAEAIPEVDRVALTFPEMLGPADRPEVAATLAAAAAELRHPDPIEGRRSPAVPTLAAPVLPVAAADLEARAPATLPASIALDSSEHLGRAAQADALLQAALP